MQLIQQGIEKIKTSALDSIHKNKGLTEGSIGVDFGNEANNWYNTRRDFKKNPYTKKELDNMSPRKRNNILKNRRNN